MTDQQWQKALNLSDEQVKSLRRLQGYCVGESPEMMPSAQPLGDLIRQTIVDIAGGD